MVNENERSLLHMLWRVVGDERFDGDVADYNHRLNERGEK